LAHTQQQAGQVRLTATSGPAKLSNWPLRELLLHDGDVYGVGTLFVREVGFSPGPIVDRPAASFSKASLTSFLECPAGFG
jgi:hypothetical protein